MTDLSQKFGSLMARMAKTDAELFRTISDHNKAVTDQVMDLTTHEENGSGSLALISPPLLPLEERSETALKKRFGNCKAAFAWLEEKLGPPPSKRLSWSTVVATVTSGQWPSTTITTKSAGVSNTHLADSLDQINKRLDGIEAVLALILSALEK